MFKDEKFAALMKVGISKNKEFDEDIFVKIYEYLFCGDKKCTTALARSVPFFMSFVSLYGSCYTQLCSCSFRKQYARLLHLVNYRGFKFIWGIYLY